MAVESGAQLRHERIVSARAPCSATDPKVREQAPVGPRRLPFRPRTLGWTHDSLCLKLLATAPICKISDQQVAVVSLAVVSLTPPAAFWG